jgi:endonuclease/exonuclease/phosphatase family metal-dependent hydrolase
MFWNVENFGRHLEGDDSDPEGHRIRVEKVEEHIRNLDPDLFCLCEIKDKVALRSLLIDKFTDYDIGVTDGVEGIELLTAFRRGKFQQLLFTQRREFKAGNQYLRPGSLTSVKFDDEYYNILFLHTDSGRKIKDYNNRQEMFEKIWSLKQVLDDITEGTDTARLVVMGDLNTMGRSRSGDFQSITGAKEIEDLSRDAEDHEMGLLPKTHSNTWRKGPSNPDFESNLDHGIATTNITFEELENATSSTPAAVSVDGWNHLYGEDRDDFSENISDHCSIFCKIL